MRNAHLAPIWFLENRSVVLVSKVLCFHHAKTKYQKGVACHVCVECGESSSVDTPNCGIFIN